MKSKRVLSLMMAAALMTGSAGTALYATDISAVAASAKLEAPTGLKYTALTEKSVKLSWNAVGNAKMYAVYKYDSKSGKYKVYRKVNTTSCEVTGLKASTRYKFRVAAIKYSGGKLTAQTKTDPLSVKTKGETDSTKPGTIAGTGVKLPKSEGRVFNIYAWNEEFKGFFDKYYVVPSGITVNWVINPADDGTYQDRLDSALQRQGSAAADDKVDLFLVEPDYIRKYVDSDYTMDVSKIGVKPLKTEYQYTIDAATDSKGKLKGVSFQCCPGALIFRRSIAEDVLGTSDPDKVQSKLSTWEKFSAAAESAKDKGYYMTSSYEFTYRVFSENKTKPWVSSKGRLTLDDDLLYWANMSNEMVSEKSASAYNLWTDVVFAQMSGDGKTMCFFGPAWYYNFCMWNAQDPDRGCYGDWAICQGPDVYYWGGTWMLAAKGSDNPKMIADVMNAFTANKDICTKLAENENQFTNNMTVNQRCSKDASFNNQFLGGQNDYAVMHKIAKNIKYNKAAATQYDLVLDNGFTDCMRDYITGYITFDDAYESFLSYVMDRYPAIKIS